MNADHSPEPLPGWVVAVAEDLARLRRAGSRASDEACAALGGFLRLLEVEDFPPPRVEVLGPRMIRLAWADGRRSMWLEVGPRRKHLAVSCPKLCRRLAPAVRAGRTVDATRAAFDWYRPRPTRRNP